MSHFGSYSETEKRYFNTPLHYFVAQIQRKKLTLALDLSRHEAISAHVPMLLDLNLENIFPKPIGHPFDTYVVKSYTITKLDGVEKEVQKFGQDRIRDLWRNRNIIAKAHAKQYEMVYRF